MMGVGGKKEMRKGFWSWHGMRGRGVRAPDGPIWGPTLPNQPTTETQKTDQCKLLCNKAQNSGITNILVTSPSVKLI